MIRLTRLHHLASVALATTSATALAQEAPPPMPPLPPASSPAPAAEPAQPAPAPPPAAAPEPTGTPSAESKVEARVSLDQPPRRSREPDDSNDYERRVVVFTDGASPRIVSSGDQNVQGPLELEIRFRNASPLCYTYSTNVAAHRVAASDRALPPRAPSPSSFAAVAPATFTDVDDAFAAVTVAQNEIDDVLNAARFQISLDEVWGACDGGADVNTQLARVETAARVSGEKMGNGGVWRLALERAEAAALGAKRIARQIESDGSATYDDVEAKRASLREAEQRVRALEAQPQNRRAAEDLAVAQRDIADAQRRLREAELRAGKGRRAADLGRAAERLSVQVRDTQAALVGIAAEINRARALIAQSPTAVRSRFAPGEKVDVVIERHRLDRGERVSGRGPQLFKVPSFRTRHPVLLDIGIGPALAIGENDSKYETVWSPLSERERTPTWRVIRTDQGLDLDLMVSLSLYLWKRRSLDDRIFDAWQLIPRPFLGVSLDRPFDTLYAGLQIDPIQYLNFGGGVRIASRDKLIGPQPGDRALLDDQGDPQPPVTREEIQVSAFLSVTVSTNLVYRWIQQGL